MRVCGSVAHWCTNVSVRKLSLHVYMARMSVFVCVYLQLHFSTTVTGTGDIMVDSVGRKFIDADVEARLIQSWAV